MVLSFGFGVGAGESSVSGTYVYDFGSSYSVVSNEMLTISGENASVSLASEPFSLYSVHSPSFIMFTAQFPLYILREVKQSLHELHLVNVLKWMSQASSKGLIYSATTELFANLHSVVMRDMSYVFVLSRVSMRNKDPPPMIFFCFTMLLYLN